MTYDEALRKAAACLRLAADHRGSPEESALATAKAQEIMDRYEISHSAASRYGSDDHQDDQIVDDHAPIIEVCQKNTKWVGYLVAVLANHNG